jgi:CheY-like chemotaxis protein
MGGSLGVDSEPGVGSTFWIELAQAEEPAVESDLEDDHSTEGSMRSGEARTILYIEDNVYNFQLLQRIFQQRPNIRLIPAMQGRLGIDLAREHQPDLILLDVHLPDMSGLDVLAELRGDPDLRHIPVIVISADATHKQINAMLNCGADDYLTKPFDVRQLVATVTRSLESDRAVI